MSQTNPSWFALYVRSRHEKSVVAQLTARNFEAFVPLYSERRRWADRWKTVSLPLFPGYLFCRFGAAEKSAVLTTSGLIDVVRRGSEIGTISDEEIQDIQRVSNSLLTKEPYEGLLVGQTVLMTQGPLAGMTGTLAQDHKGIRFVLNVGLLNRSVLVEVDRDWLVPVAPQGSGPTSSEIKLPSSSAMVTLPRAC